MGNCIKKPRYDVSRQRMGAMERGNLAEVACNLFESRRSESDSIMTQLVSRDQWDAVKQVIRCVGDEERTWDIGGVSVKNSILLLVAEGNWRGIGDMSNERFFNSTLKWILQQACTQAKQTDIVQYVLPHCEDDQLDSALQQLVTHGLWFAAGRMLQRPVSDERVRWVIQQACQRAEELALRSYVIPYYPNSTLDFLLSELVSRDMWQAAGRVMMRGVSHTRHCWALKEACCRAEGWQVKRFILPFCTQGHCNSVLTYFVTESQWGVVDRLLHLIARNISISVVADGMYVNKQCLYLICDKDFIGILTLLGSNATTCTQLHTFCLSTDCVFRIYQWYNNVLQPVKLNESFTWKYGIAGFPRYVKDMQSVFAVTTFSTGVQRERIVCIIPRCAGHQLDSVFTQCSNKYLRRRPSHELACNPSDLSKTWTIHMLDVNPTTTKTTAISSSKSAEENIHSVLRHMLTLPVWWALGKVMEQGLDDNSVTQILKQTLLYDEDQMIVEHVLPHCTDSQTDLAVTELVSAGQWKSVAKLMRLVGDRKQTWTVDETSVDTTLLHLVAGGRWGEVGDMLQRGVDDKQRRWLIHIASHHADSTDLLDDILPHCADDQLDSVLTTLVERRLWQAVGEALKRGVSDSVKQWAVMETCIHYNHDYKYKGDVGHLIIDNLSKSDDDGVDTCNCPVTDATLHDIVLHCADDQLDFVLEMLAKRGLWGSVVQLFRRGVSDSQRQFIIEKACTLYEEACIIQYVLHHTDEDQQDVVLKILVKRGMWQAVEILFRRGVSGNVKQWAVLEACNCCSELFITESVLCHCADDELDSVLTTLVKRRMWLAIVKVLERSVSDSVKRWAVETTCQHCTKSYHVDDVDNYIVKYILPHCADDQLDTVLTTLVARRLWLAVVKVLERSVSDSVKRWAVETTCQHCEKSYHVDDVDNYIVVYILPHCVDDQLDTVLTTLVERRLWLAVVKVLERGVRDSHKRWAVIETCKHYNNDYNYISVVVINDNPSDCESDYDDGVDACRCPVTSVSDCEFDYDDGVDACHCSVTNVSDCESDYDDDVDTCHCPVTNVSDCESDYDDGVDTCRCPVTDTTLRDIVSHCVDDQLDVVLETLATRGLWGAVVQLFRRGVSDSQRQFIIEKACTLYGEACIIQYVLHHTDEDQQEVVLNILVKRGMWQAVEILFRRGVSENVKQRAVQVACSCCSELVITKSVLCHCADDQLDTVLTTLVERRLWLAVVKVLERSVSDSVKRWAVETTCQHCEKSYHVDDVDNYIVVYILPHCVDDQLDTVLTTLVERRQWLAVVKVLERGVSDSHKRWAVIETCKHYNNDYNYISVVVINDNPSDCESDYDDGVDACRCPVTNVSDCEVDYDDGVDTCRCPVTDTTLHDIVLHCADDQLDVVLETLATRGLWGAVVQLFRRGVSDSQRQFIIENACTLYKEACIIQYVLHHTDEDQHDVVLNILLERGMWQAVGEVLKRVDRDSKKDLAGQETCEHCRSAGVYFSEYRVHDSDRPVHDTFSQPALTTRDECTAVRKVSGQQVSDAQRRENIKAAFQCADENSLIESILPYYVYDSVHSALKMLASRGFWSAFLMLLHNTIIDTLYMWAVARDTESKDEVFVDMIRNPCVGVKGLIPAMWRSVTWSGLQRSLKQLLDWDTPLCEVLCESLLGTVKEIWLSGRESEINGPEHTVTKEASSTVEHLHQLLVECKIYHVSDLLSCTEGLRHEYSKRQSANCFVFQLYFIKNLVHQYYKRKAWKQMTDAILIVLTTVPVVPDVQSVALRVMLRHNRWDVIKHACLSGVCEQDRRQLFQAAVKQRQWSAVKRWADHTLYDDQRLWALGEARQEKRWDVYLKLADHGLSEWERVGVLFRVTMHADLTLVHHMLTTVADVTDMIDLLTNTPGVVSKLGAKNKERRMNDLKVFENNLMKDTHTLKTLKTMAKRGKWWVVLHNIRHKPNLQHARCALKAAVSSEAWHAVMQLVRLETDVTRRDSLFRDMARLRQWAVCKELLEKGVNHYLSLKFLPEFIEHCQWTLVAMVMECTMGDDRRKKIMYQAIMMREGSVVWECVSKLQTRLSVHERKDLFQLAFSREVWQAVKPLIEEKDETGIRHRDTALLEAIEQHQWDVVDHCQRHHADINMKDDDGHTPIHRAARKEDWEAVKELTVRDGDPNLLDSDGLSVLHRAIEAKQWDAVQLLIQFHGDIHQAPRCKKKYDYERKTRTPLQMLIDARQGEVIETSLMWCPDQQKVVNYKRETALHAVCLSGWPDTLYHLIARKVDPLAVTRKGLTALCYAVLCKDCPQRMVAECIKLGFSTHQSHITRTARIYMTPWFSLVTEEGERLLMFPLVLAVMRGLPVVTQMLCEAGEYSNRQFRKLNIHLVQLTIPDTGSGREFRRAFSKVWKDVHNLEFNDPGYPFDTELVQQSADYLREMCSTPRSLVSTCRLVISRCLTLSKTRHRDIAQLPLSPMMKNYLMFSDLTDPRYPDLSYRGKE